MTNLVLESFQLYTNLLTEDAHQPWDFIVKELFGVERKKSPGKRPSHQENPNKVWVRQFVQRVMQLNNYMEDLLCMYYSPSASMMTQQVYSFTDLELSCHILCMCPLMWQDQYHLLEKCYLGGVKPLLLILEQIEVAHPVDERQLSSKPAEAQGAEQPSKKFALGARIPKKPKQARTDYTRVDKNCELCKKHGGAHTMHNTVECRRYNKDGTPTRGTFGQAAQKSREDSHPKNSYAQVLACMEKLEKSIKKANRKDKKCCCHKESDSNSNSSCSIGLGSTGETENSCKKTKTNHELATDTTHGPIKTISNQKLEQI
eukprot:CCRYP_009287-RA/>CCRYP_009287-RA protein AED:0.81 eAED:1.00 QI:0/0/0/0.5/1/1/2/0/315